MRLTILPHEHVSPEPGKGEFARFCQHLLAYHPGKWLQVIHNRGEQQQGASVDAVVREGKGRLVFKAQPTYAPELNPPEWICTCLRRIVPHHHWLATLTEQTDTIRHFFRYLAGVKDQVRHLCGFKTTES